MEYANKGVYISSTKLGKPNKDSDDVEFFYGPLLLPDPSTMLQDEIGVRGRLRIVFNIFNYQEVDEIELSASDKFEKSAARQYYGTQQYAVSILEDLERIDKYLEENGATKKGLKKYYIRFYKATIISRNKPITLKTILNAGVSHDGYIVIRLMTTQQFKNYTKKRRLNNRFLCQKNLKKLHDILISSIIERAACNTKGIELVPKLKEKLLASLEEYPEVKPINTRKPIKTCNITTELVYCLYYYIMRQRKIKLPSN